MQVSNIQFNAAGYISVRSPIIIRRPSWPVPPEYRKVEAIDPAKGGLIDLKA